MSEPTKFSKDYWINVFNLVQYMPIAFWANTVSPHCLRITREAHETLSKRKENPVKFYKIVVPYPLSAMTLLKLSKYSKSPYFIHKNTQKGAEIYIIDEEDASMLVLLDGDINRWMEMNNAKF